MPPRAVLDTLERLVLPCEDLILHKLLAGRIIDQVDVAALLRANRGAVDTAYLDHWATQLGVKASLQRAVAEAGQQTEEA